MQRKPNTRQYSLSLHRESLLSEFEQTTTEAQKTPHRKKTGEAGSEERIYGGENPCIGHSTFSESVSQAYKPFYFEKIAAPGTSFHYMLGGRSYELLLSKQQT